MGGGVDFDKDNLDFEESRHNLFFYIKKGFKWFVLCSLLAVCYYALFSLVFSNEQERKILKESRAIEENLAYMEEQMRKNNIPLYALESGDPIKEFDIIGFTLQYEMSYSNVINMLDLAKVPIRQSERGEGAKNGYVVFVQVGSQ